MRTGTLIAIVATLFAIGCGGGGAAAPAPATQNGQPAAPAQAAGADVYVHNQSSYDIFYFYMSPTSQSTWGEDRLGPSDTLASGESGVLQNVACDRYDIKLVDEDGDECEIRDTQVCSDSELTITNDWLLHCEGYR